MKKKQIIQILMIAVLLSYMIGCEVDCWGIFSPDNPIDDNNELPQYWSKVKVTYDRNPAKITFPQGNDAATDIVYRLYDPNADKNKLENERIQGWYRVGGVNTEKVGEYRFVGYIEKVFVQTESHFRKHEVYIRDAKLYDGLGDVSTYTAEGIVIEGSYDLSITGYTLYFKMSKK